MPSPDRSRPRRPNSGGSSDGQGRGRAPQGSGRGGAPKGRSGGAPTDRNRGKRPDERGEPGPKAWGALARRGSQRLSEDIRDAGTKPPHQGPPAPKEPMDRWVREDDVR